MACNVNTIACICTGDGSLETSERKRLTDAAARQIMAEEYLFILVCTENRPLCIRVSFCSLVILSKHVSVQCDKNMVLR